MALLNELYRCGKVVGHAQSVQNSRQPSSAKAADRDLLFDLTELAAPARSCCADNAHIVEFLEEEGFVLVADGVSSIKICELMCKLPGGIIRIMYSKGISSDKIYLRLPHIRLYLV